MALQYDSYKETYDDDGHQYHFTVTCKPHFGEGCGKKGLITVPGPELFNYQSTNMLLQDAMPSVNADERDWLCQSHLCPDCWTKMTLTE